MPNLLFAKSGVTNPNKLPNEPVEVAEPLMFPLACILPTTSKTSAGVPVPIPVLPCPVTLSAISDKPLVCLMFNKL